MARLEESVRQANEALMDNDRIRSEYVLRVSHDLQSPLSATYSMLSLVSTTLADSMSDKARDFVSRSLRRLEALMGYARGIHEISRIRAARSLALAPFGLRSVAESAAEEILSAPHEQPIDLSIDIPSTIPFVLGDRDQIRTALIRILTNAAQYAVGGVRITIRAREVAGQVEIEIQDTGIGIPPEELPHVFDEFFRGTMARELQPNGWGLGLTLVRLIVARHGGAVRVASELGHGSQFTIAVPAHTNGG